MSETADEAGAQSSMAPMVQRTRSGDVTTLELQRAAKRNALNTQLCDEMRTAVDAAVSEGARVIVITGQGTVFCAGADLSGDVYSSRFPLALVEMLGAIEGASVPVVAAVNGPAVGAGTQLALACDLRVAASAARFEIPVAKVGLAVHNWTVHKLREIVGGGHARTMLMGAESMGARQAVTLGLANRSGDLRAARAWAAELATLAPLSLRHMKAVFNDDGGRESTEEQNALFAAAWASEDKAEASRARREGRAPRFLGR